VGDDVAVFVHGRARVIPGGPGEADAIRHFWTEVYDASPEDWVSAPGDARYVEILPVFDVLLRLLARAFRSVVRARGALGIRRVSQ